MNGRPVYIHVLALRNYIHPVLPTIQKAYKHDSYQMSHGTRDGPRPNRSRRGQESMGSGNLCAVHVARLRPVRLHEACCGAVFVVGFGKPGNCLGYHRLLISRLWTPVGEYVLTRVRTLAWGGPIFWVATHRIHHQHSDQEGDPHTPLDGKWWAHMGWILMGKSMHHDTTTLARYVPDLAKSKFHVWITKYHYVPIIVLGLVLLALADSLLCGGFSAPVALPPWL